MSGLRAAIYPPAGRHFIIQRTKKLDHCVGARSKGVNAGLKHEKLSGPGACSLQAKLCACNGASSSPPGSRSATAAWTLQGSTSSEKVSIPITPSETLDRPSLMPREATPAVGVTAWRVIAVLLVVAALACGSGLLPPQVAAASGTATGSTGQTIATSSLGIKIASWVRSATGGALPDDAIVLLLAALPVVELRGAIPVAYWLGMPPIKASILAVLGNMLPVPFLLLFLGPLSEALTAWNAKAKQGVDWVLDYTRKKAGPIVEFQALGLMLFVAVPLPGTGAWSGAIAAYVLKLPFWEAFFANFFGVLLAGAIVTALCLLGFREASLLAVGLFIVSGLMWSGLRAVLPKKA